MADTAKKIFIFGIGYVGKYLADSLIRAGHYVAGTSSQNHNGVFCYDMRDSNTHKDILQKVSESDTVVSTIPPINGKDVVISLLNKQVQKPKQAIYCSTTGVYKNTDGAYVDEVGELSLNIKISRDRIEAEQSWLNKYRAVRLRLGGIYGPKRNLISSFMRTPTKVVKGSENHYFNRIHVEDIAAVIHEVINFSLQNEVINVVDNCPASIQEVLHYIFKEMNLDPRQYMEETSFNEISPMMQYFYRSNKQIMNQKLKTLLLYKFKYPTYKEGFKNIIANKQYIL